MVSAKEVPKQSVPFARFWVATENFLVPEEQKEVRIKKRSKKPRVVYLECERFFDAKVVAQFVLGTINVNVKPYEAKRKPLPRMQVKWGGSVIGINTLHRLVRVLKREHEDREKTPKWKDLREFNGA